MNKLPAALLDSLKDIRGFDREAFEKLHESDEQVTSVRVNPAKTKSPLTMVHGPWSMDKIPWTEYGYYLSQRPSFTFDPLFHAGCYYVQEASSMFLEQALKQTVDLSKPLRVLDISAAPGGKSTHIQSLISKESLLVSNEVIRQRSLVLQDNIIKWGAENVVVTSSDPSRFSALENFFDVIVADVPCSGSGLFRRDEEAIDEWSINNVQLCSRRQQRILADILPALKKDGILIYSTCSYSKEEDEDIMDWVTSEFQISNCRLQIEDAWGITEVQSSQNSYGYRFWPDKVKGEGFFIACFKKTTGDDAFYSPKKKGFERLNKNERAVVDKWINDSDHKLIKFKDVVHALPKNLTEDINAVYNAIGMNYAGVMIGELIRDKLVPAHALAMSKLIANDIGQTELDYENAILYLKKKELNMSVATKGWQLVNFKTHILGWINVLPNRINNYYPKELRILKD